MRAVSRGGAWAEWAAVFLEGRIEPVRENQPKAQTIVALHRRMLSEVAQLTHSPHSGRAVELLFARPCSRALTSPVRRVIPNRRRSGCSASSARVRFGWTPITPEKELCYAQRAADKRSISEAKEGVN